ncbi:MAG TPA: acetate--CoA ligase family protein [Solirubrobacterales bacterium]
MVTAGVPAIAGLRAGIACAAVVAGRVAHAEDDAAAILAEHGPPVAAKLSGEGLRHKTELGALVLDLATEAEVRDAYRRLRAPGRGAVLVEQQAPPGVERC